jgi:hypothetical protein
MTSASFRVIATLAVSGFLAGCETYPNNYILAPATVSRPAEPGAIYVYRLYIDAERPQDALNSVERMRFETVSGGAITVHRLSWLETEFRAGPGVNESTAFRRETATFYRAVVPLSQRGSEGDIRYEYDNLRDADALFTGAAGTNVEIRGRGVVRRRWRATASGLHGRVVHRFRVRGNQTLSLPSGTFRTIVIDRVTLATEGGGRDFRTVSRGTVWYAPRLRWFVQVDTYLARSPDTRRRLILWRGATRSVWR